MRRTELIEHSATLLVQQSPIVRFCLKLIIYMGAGPVFREREASSGQQSSSLARKKKYTNELYTSSVAIVKVPEN